MTQSYTITKSKPVFALIGTTVTALAKIDQNQDSNISFMEGANAAQTIGFKAIATFRGDIKDLRNELTDLDEAEKAELNEELARNLEMYSRKVEALTERAIKIVVDIIDLVIDVQKPEEAFDVN